MEAPTLPSFSEGAEKYGLAGNDRKQCAYEIVPTEAMHCWKVAWESARKAAKVSCRFHDLRQTFISRLAESQASGSTVMALAGHVSRAMMERYSHIRMEALRLLSRQCTAFGGFVLDLFSTLNQ